MFILTRAKLIVDFMMNKYKRYLVFLALFGTLTLAGCSADADVKAVKERESYNSIDLNKLSSQGVSLTGSDPKEIAIGVFPPPDEEPQEGNFKRDVTVEAVKPTFKTVIITQTGLLDDSLNGIRHRADFESSGADNNSWTMVWVGKQYKCYPGRGSQDWSKELCS